MDELDPNILTPGVRRTVLWLRSHGFATCDSGDGRVNVEAGMEGALSWAHVHILTTPADMVVTADRLFRLLAEAGVLFDMEQVESPSIEASYSPIDGVALVSLFRVDDDLLIRYGVVG